MRRRDLITMLGGTVLGWPIGVRAQISTRPLIGMLYPASQAVSPPNVGAFRTRLAELGLIEGRNYELAIRYVLAPSDRDAVLSGMTELLALSPSVIVFGGTATAPWIHQLKSSVPMVGVGLGGDPVALGLAESLAHPGGNITGMMGWGAPTIVGKQLALLKELVPSTDRVDALLGAEDTVTPAVLQDTARALKLTLRTFVISNREELAPMIAGASAGADALYVGTGPFVNTHRLEIVTRIAETRLPSCWAGNKDAVTDGALMSYGSNITKNYGLAGDYVVEILRGAKPADLPIQLPDFYELVINLKTAKTLGISIPPTLLARADQVIE